MKESSPALTIQHLADRNLISGDGLERARLLFAGNHKEDSASPWFIKVLLIVGAWLSAIFFLGFLGIAGFLDGSDSGVVLGSLLIVIAAGLLWAARATKGLRSTLEPGGANLFVEQSLTALSIAGHLLLVGSVAWNGNVWAAATVAWLLLAVTYPLFPVSIHRWFTCHFAALTLCIVAVAEGAPAWSQIAVLVAAAGCLLFHSGRVDRPLWRPAAYASITILLGLPIIQKALGGSTLMLHVPFGPFHEGVTAIAVVTVLPMLAFYLQRHRPSAWPILGLTSVLLAAIALFTTPVLAYGLWVFIIAHLRGDKLLAWLGAMGLSVGLGVYYYQLDATLLTKSISMIALGAILLSARAGLAFAGAKRARRLAT